MTLFLGVATFGIARVLAGHNAIVGLSFAAAGLSLAYIVRARDAMLPLAREGRLAICLQNQELTGSEPPLHPEAKPGTYPPLPLIEGDRQVKVGLTPDDQSQLTTWYTERAVSFIEKHKDRPFFLLDTHAGSGVYDLGGEAASRTGEFRDGIARVLQASAPPSAGRSSRRCPACPCDRIAGRSVPTDRRTPTARRTAPLCAPAAC